MRERVHGMLDREPAGGRAIFVRLLPNGYRRLKAAGYIACSPPPEADHAAR